MKAPDMPSLQDEDTDCLKALDFESSSSSYHSPSSDSVYIDDVDRMVCHQDFPNLLALAARVKELRDAILVFSLKRDSSFTWNNSSRLTAATMNNVQEVMNAVSRIQEQHTFRFQKGDAPPVISRGTCPMTDSILEDSFNVLLNEAERCQEYIKLLTEQQQKEQPSPEIKDGAGIAIKYSKWQTDLLMEWVIKHKDHPFPSNTQILELANTTGLAHSQVVNWTTNVRKRNLKATVEDKKKPHHFIDFLFLAQEREKPTSAVPVPIAVKKKIEKQSRSNNSKEILKDPALGLKPSAMQLQPHHLPPSPPPVPPPLFVHHEYQQMQQHPHTDSQPYPPTPSFHYASHPAPPSTAYYPSSAMHTQSLLQNQQHSYGSPHQQHSYYNHSPPVVYHPSHPTPLDQQNQYHSFFQHDPVRLGTALSVATASNNEKGQYEYDDWEQKLRAVSKSFDDSSECGVVATSLFDEPVLTHEEEEERDHLLTFANRWTGGKDVDISVEGQEEEEVMSISIPDEELEDASMDLNIFLEGLEVESKDQDSYKKDEIQSNNAGISFAQCNAKSQGNGSPLHEQLNGSDSYFKSETTNTCSEQLAKICDHPFILEFDVDHDIGLDNFLVEV